MRDEGEIVESGGWRGETVERGDGGEGGAWRGWRTWNVREHLTEKTSDKLCGTRWGGGLCGGRVER